MEEEQAEAYNAEKEAALQAELEKQQAEEEAKKAAEEAAKAEKEDKDFDLTGLASKFLGVVAMVGLAAVWPLAAGSTSSSRRRKRNRPKKKAQTRMPTTARVRKNWNSRWRKNRRMS